MSNFEQAIHNMIHRLRRQDKKLLAFEEKLDRQNKELLEAIWLRKKVKEMVFQGLGLGAYYLFNGKQLYFLKYNDCHRLTIIPPAASETNTILYEN